MNNQISELRDRLNLHYGSEVFLFVDENEDTIYNVDNRYEGNDLHIDYIDNVFECRITGHRICSQNLDEIYNEIIEWFT